MITEAILNFLATNREPIKYNTEIDPVRPADEFIHPSQFYQCKRKQVYTILLRDKINSGEIAEVMPTPETRLKFDVGTICHRYIQAILKRIYGDDFQAEVETPKNEYNIYGHPDGILYYEENLYLIEIKTINDSGFKKLTLPAEPHFFQAMGYVLAWRNEEFPITKTIFLYFNKDKNIFKESIIDYNDETTIEIITDDINNINNSVKTGNITCERECNSKYDHKIGDYRCPFANICFET